METTIKELLQDQTYYGRLMRWIFWLRWEKVSKYAKVKLTEKKENSIRYYAFTTNELAQGLAQSYREKRIEFDLKMWSINFYRKSQMTENLPKEIKEIAKMFYDDFDDIVAGKKEHLLTEEMKKHIAVKIVNL